jgi:cyclopropane fatty-acyl-phospholipid synthase-like methyltransferase
MAQIGQDSLSYDYDADFYKEVTDGSICSANAAVPILAELFQPRTVLDVGCGAGAWVKAWQDVGVKAIGMDGIWAKDHLLISEEDFISCDLVKHISFPTDGV